MSFTREDMLKELELLPVWKLKNGHQPTQQVAVKKPENSPNTTQEKIAKKWVFAYVLPNTEIEACQQLMQNIIKAMQILPEEYVLVNGLEQMQKYQAQAYLLFGIEIAQICIDKSVQDIETFRGEQKASATNLSVESKLPLESTCWVTYHPLQMFSNPALKKVVWHDITQALRAMRA